MKIEIKILNKKFYGYRQGKHSKNYPIDTGYKGILPQYQTLGSAAMDLVCTKNVILYPGECKMIPTGLAIWIGSANPRELTVYENQFSVAGLILPRSGLGTKGLVLANTIGLMDEDYQGELIVSAWNRNDRTGWEDFYMDETNKKHWLGKEPYDKNNSKDSAIQIRAGDRFAQLMFVPVIKAEWEIVENFSNNTQRGSDGFGHTGG